MRQIGTIEIAAIGLRHDVYEGITLHNIDHGPSHWPGSALPGQVGNAVFAGHRVTHSHPFRRIDELVAGDTVVFDIGGTRSTYRVTGDEVVTPTDTWIANPTPTPTATLFACHPPGSARYRYVVHSSWCVAAAGARLLKQNASRVDVGTRKEAPVTHMVIFRSPEGKPGYHQAEGLDEAMRFAEMLRNQEQVTDARIFRMDEVPIEFKTYYRVEMAAAAGSGTAAAEMPASEAPADRPLRSRCDRDAGCIRGTSRRRRRVGQRERRGRTGRRR